MIHVKHFEISIFFQLHHGVTQFEGQDGNEGNRSQTPDGRARRVSDSLDNGPENQRRRDRLSKRSVIKIPRNKIGVPAPGGWRFFGYFLFAQKVPGGLGRGAHGL